MSKRSKKVLLMPIYLIGGSILAYAVTNFAFGAASSDPLQTSSSQTVVNTILYLVLLCTVIATPICLILGISWAVSDRKKIKAE